MIAGSISLAGEKELQQFLKELPNRMQKKHLDFALRRAAEPMLNRAKALAPVETGQVKRSLKITELKKKRRGVKGLRITTEAGDYRGDEFYAAFQEYGWNKRPVIRLANGRIRSLKRGRGKGTQIPGKFFMKRAFEATQHLSRELFFKALRVSIRAEAQVLADKSARAIATQSARENRLLKQLAKNVNG